MTQVSLSVDSFDGPIVNIFSGICHAPFSMDDMCMAPATDPSIFFSAGFECDILLTDLAFNMTYYYKYGDEYGTTSATLTSLFLLL